MMPIKNQDSHLADSSALEKMNEELALLTFKCISDEGLKGSGAYSYYRDRAERRCILHPREVELCRRMLAALPKEVTYHELAAQAATISILLAVSGANVTAFERDSLRSKLSARFLSCLVGIGYKIESRLRLVNEDSASPITEWSRSKIDGLSAVVVSKNVNSYGKKNEQKLVELMSKYDYCILDLMAFCHNRASLSAQGELLFRFYHCGMTECVDLFVRPTFRYVILTSKAYAAQIRGQS